MLPPTAPTPSPGADRPERGAPIDGHGRGACAQCSVAKAKCLRSAVGAGAKCDRCHRLGKSCTGRLPKVRRKRGSKPSKTEQIEERLTGLVKLLEASGKLPAGFPTNGDPAGNQPSNTAVRAIDETHVPLPSGPSIELSQQNGVAAKPSQDVQSQFTRLNLGTSGPILIPDTYNRHGPARCICRPVPGLARGPMEPDDVLWRIFQDELTPAFPFIVIPKDTTAAHLRATRPFLMACIRMVASFRDVRSMQAQMYQLMTHVAETMLVQSERSLDLLAGIVVILGWHHHHCYVHGQLHNLVSLATTLTAELGLKRSPSWQERTKLMVVSLGEVKERTSEEKRLVLAVWYLSSCVSVGFQQLDPMRFTPYMQQCLQSLEEGAEVESDACLVQLVRMQRLSEKIASVMNAEAEVSEGLENNVPRAPVSGYISAFRGEFDRLQANISPAFRQNWVIKAHLSTLRLRLHEPPSLNSALLASISQSLTAPLLVPGLPSALDELHHSTTMLRGWFDEWLLFPASSYHFIPLPVSLNIIYAVTMLGRWAKLLGPGSVRPVSSSVPPDPSGHYNNRASASAASTPMEASSTTESASPPFLQRGGQLAQGIRTLRMQLIKQPGLSLDVTGTLSMMCRRMEEASELMTQQDAELGTQERNVWTLSATKLRIAQLKLEEWAEMVSQEMGDQAPSAAVEDAPHPMVSDGQDTTVYMDLAGYAGDTGEHMGGLTGGDWFDNGGGFLWTETWGDWGIQFM